MEHLDSNILGEEVHERPLHLRQNFLSVDESVALNSYGEYFKAGDRVVHEGAKGEARIVSFELHKEYNEIKAHTTKGWCHIDFITKAPSFHG